MGAIAKPTSAAASTVPWWPPRYTIGGRPYLSVTQVLKAQGMSPNYDDVPMAVLSAAASRGTDVHGRIEKIIALDPISPVNLAELDGTWEAGATRSAARWWMEQNMLHGGAPTMLRQEDLVTLPGYALAGRLDLLAVWPDGFKRVVDWKGTSDSHVGHLIQACLYSMMEPTDPETGEVSALSPRVRGTLTPTVVYLLGTGETARAVEADQQKRAYYARHAIAAAGIMQFRMNLGLLP